MRRHDRVAFCFRGITEEVHVYEGLAGDDSSDSVSVLSGVSLEVSLKGGEDFVSEIDGIEVLGWASSGVGIVFTGLDVVGLGSIDCPARKRWK